MKISRPSPSFAIALLALFVALGGTSYATARVWLPANSVGTPQILNDSVTRAKIAHQSITSVLIKPGSLLATDFAPGQLPAGPQGATGPRPGRRAPRERQARQGPKGDTGTIANDPGPRRRCDGARRTRGRHDRDLPCRRTRGRRGHVLEPRLRRERLRPHDRVAVAELRLSRRDVVHGPRPEQHRDRAPVHRRDPLLPAVGAEGGRHGRRPPLDHACADTGIPGCRP